MSKWIRNKLPEFVRDVLRDFCLVSRILETAFDEYDRKGVLSFTTFQDFVGDEMNKGQIWRLKDTAHTLFRNEPENSVIGQYLDLSIGYIFHECMKLREDVYQQENYRPWFQSMQRTAGLSPEERLVGKELLHLIDQTRESINREVNRVRFILFHCRRLFILYLPAHRDNPLLARFFFDHEEMVRKVFKADYNSLINAVYSARPESMYLLAASSLRRGGWFVRAQEAVDRVIKTEPDNKQALQEKETIARMKEQLKVV
ncbi:MAG: hypothetical protein ACLFSY_05030 [Desulfonatronovibrionaceae bacterium]